MPHLTDTRSIILWKAAAHADGATEKLDQLPPTTRAAVGGRPMRGHAIERRPDADGHARVRITGAITNGARS
jgi:hypothetical protein